MEDLLEGRTAVVTVSTRLNHVTRPLGDVDRVVNCQDHAAIFPAEQV